MLTTLTRHGFRTMLRNEAVKAREGYIFFAKNGHSIMKRYRAWINHHLSMHVQPAKDMPSGIRALRQQCSQSLP